MCGRFALNENPPQACELNLAPFSFFNAVGAKESVYKTGLGMN